MGKKLEISKLQLPSISASSLKVIFEDHRTYASSSAVSFGLIKIISFFYLIMKLWSSSNLYRTLIRRLLYHLYVLLCSKLFLSVMSWNHDIFTKIFTAHLHVSKHCVWFVVWRMEGRLYLDISKLAYMEIMIRYPYIFVKTIKNHGKL